MIIFTFAQAWKTKVIPSCNGWKILCFKSESIYSNATRWISRMWISLAKKGKTSFIEGPNQMAILHPSHLCARWSRHWRCPIFSIGHHSCDSCMRASFPFNLLPINITFVLYALTLEGEIPYSRKIWNMWPSANISWGNSLLLKQSISRERFKPFPMVAFSPKPKWRKI